MTPDGLPNGPSVTELARRIQRVEDKLDERIATVDMLRSTERLFEARELTHSATTQNLEHRVNALERRSDSLQRMVIGASLVLLINIVVLVLTIVTKGTQ